jgi:hypothetical protein
MKKKRTGLKKDETFCKKTIKWMKRRNKHPGIDEPDFDNFTRYYYRKKNFKSNQIERNHIVGFNNSNLKSNNLSSIEKEEKLSNSQKSVI